MKRYTTYLLKQIAGSGIMITLALVGAVWLTQSLKYIDFVMARGLSFITFVKLVSLLLPNLIAIIMPIALFMATLFVLNKLYSDRELIVFKALGVSNRSIALPFIMVALLFLSIVYAMNFYVNPSSTQQYKSYKASLRNSMTSFVMQPGEFKTFKNITFYVKSRYRQGQLEGLFVYDYRDPEKPFTITAERGLVTEIDNGLKLILFKGTRQDLDRKNNQPNILNFEQYSVEILNPELSGDRDLKPSELSFYELLHPPADASEKLLQKYKAETHQRILLPLNIIPFVLLALGVFLIGDFDRKGRSRQMVMAGGMAIFLEVVILALLNAGGQGLLTVFAAYGFLGITTALLIFAILRNKPLYWKGR